MARPKKNKGTKRAAKTQKRARKQREAARRQDEWLNSGGFVLANDMDWDEDDSGQPSALPDRRVIERTMREITGGDRGRTPLDQAQELVFDAFDTDDPDQRVALAERALAISPDCADAYVLLAENTDSPAEALPFYEQAVQAGRRALGDEFDSMVGHFWGILDTRPFMRALEGLACTLWSTGKRDEAVANYLEILRLNPNDNQGIRYVVAPKLLELGRLADLDNLIGQFDDDSAFWLYNKSLVAFRKAGDTPDARRLLSQAIELNRHIPPHLSGQKPPVMELPSQYSWGSVEEAQIYAFEARGAWRSVPGALAWLRKVAGIGLYEPEPTAPRLPSMDELLALPQDEEEVWQCDVREDADFLGPEHEAAGWAVIVFSVTEREIPGMEPHKRKPSADAVWRDLRTVMAEPVAGEPRRPGQIRFLDPQLFDHLQRKLDRLGIAAALVDDPDSVNAAYEEMREHVLHGVRDDRPLTEIPQQPEEVWQVDCRQLDLWLENDSGGAGRPWVALVTSPSEDTVVSETLTPEQPSLDAIWELMERGIRQPGFGEPHRPGCVEVRSADHRVALAERMDAAGIDCVVRDDLDHWDTIYTKLARHMEGRPALVPYVKVPGMTPQQVGSFFEAAAEYYRRAPWHRTPVDALIELRFDGAQPSVWYGVVIGQNGMTTGLALYEDRERVLKTMRGELSPDVGLENTSAMSLMYSEEFELAGADLDDAEQFGWPVAAPEAYPMALRIRPGRPPNTPMPEELAILEAALRVVPEFVTCGTSPLTKIVTLSQGNVAATAQWVRF